MAVGDYAAIVEYGHRNGDPTRPPDVLPLTQIDGGAGTELLIDALAPTIVNASQAGTFDALMLAVDQFATPPVVLPDGPKAIVLVGLGTIGGSSTQSGIVAFANATGIPIFTVGIGDVDLSDYSTSLLTSLAEDTGGTHVRRDEPDLALATVASLLNDAYRLSFPQATVSDCDPHVLAATVSGLGARDLLASIPLTRCDTTPEPFLFEPLIGATPGSVVVSNAVTIAGIESPVAVAVFGGKYSIGCSATFTPVPGFLSPGDIVCVRHKASRNTLSWHSTTLVVGGVSSTFSSETSAASASPTADPPPAAPATSGGGATGLLEVLLGLLAVLAGRLSAESSRRREPDRRSRPRSS